jgi:cytochrome P450
MTPGPPIGPPRFDPIENAWILTRYLDVLAALREPRLWPVDGKRRIQPEGRDGEGRLSQRAAMLDAIAGTRVEGWRPQIAAITQTALDRIPRDCTVDLLGDFTLPWGLSLAILVTRTDPAERDRLSSLGARVFAATGAEHSEVELRAGAAAATAELERILEHGPIPMGEPAFVALSQTLPRLLASAWFALIRHPEEYARLRANPGLLPGAVDELLRYAGIVRRVFRRSTAAIEIGGTRIAAGDLVLLMLASANRDPEQFPDPDRLDLTRSFTPHLALGSGRNSCVGAMLIRASASIATGALVSRFTRAVFHRVGEWRTGSGFCFPASVYVSFHPS